MDNITRFYVACCEQADELNRVLRRGPEAIDLAIAQTTSPSIGELFQLAFNDARRDDAAATTGRALTRMRRRAEQLRNVAADIRNWDNPPTTYPLQWSNVMAEFNDSRSEVWGFIPPDEPHQAATNDLSGSERGTRQRVTQTTSRGDADRKILAALTAWHDKPDGFNYEPIGGNELGRRAGVRNGSVTNFWKRRLRKDGVGGDYAAYKRSCQNESIRFSLSLWSGEMPAADVLELLTEDRDRE